MSEQERLTGKQIYWKHHIGQEIEGNKIEKQKSH